MLIVLNPLNPNDRLIDSITEKLKEGAVIIYPTDTVYALGCDPSSKKGMERLFNIKNTNPTKSPLTFMCESISQASEYSQQISNANFRFIKEYTPGPYTFIMPASNKLPKQLNVKNKTFGFRIPEHAIPLALIKSLGRPLMTSSLKSLSNDSDNAFYMNVEDIYADYSLLVDVIIDGGPGLNEQSTIVDLTGEDPVIIREGKGEVEYEEEI